MKRRNSAGQREQDEAWTVAIKILRYLTEHPDAADTADGILEWWLLKQSFFEEEKVVEKALERLFEQKLIFRVEAADTRKHYRLNAERIEESRALIREALNDEADN